MRDVTVTTGPWQPFTADGPHGFGFYLWRRPGTDCARQIISLQGSTVASQYGITGRLQWLGGEVAPILIVDAVVVLPDGFTAAHPIVRANAEGRCAACCQPLGAGPVKRVGSAVFHPDCPKIED